MCEWFFLTRHENEPKLCLFTELVIRYKTIDKWVLNEFMPTQMNHIIIISVLFECLIMVNIWWNDANKCVRCTYRNWKTETNVTWNMSRKLVFDFKQCNRLMQNGIPQFVIRLSWLRPHLKQKVSLIEMIECQIMLWLFFVKTQMIC